MDTEPEILEIPVVPRRKSLGSAIVNALIAGLLISFFLASVSSQDRRPDEMGCVFSLAAYFGLGLTILIFGLSRQTPRPGVLRIAPDHISFQGAAPGVQVIVPLAALSVAQREGRGSGENLIFKGPGTATISAGTAFLPETHGADAILEVVRQRIALLPDGSRKLEGISARAAVAERISSGRRIVVFTVSVLLVLVFLAEIATGALAHPFLLWAFGANSFRLVLHGDLFRLATANVLHGSVLHLVFNVMVLVSLGSFLEPLLGAGRFLSLLLISALVGAAGSAFLGQHSLALGASTGIAGVFAAYAVVLWRWPDRFSNPPTRNTWISMAFAFFAGSALFFENVDHMAHLAGFLAGLAVMLPEVHKVDLVELAGRRRAWFRVIAAFLVLLFLAAGGIAIRRAGDPERDLKTAAILLYDTSLPSTLQNSAVWQVATSPAASRDHLTAALNVIERVAERAPEVVEYRDTRATVLYRLGRWEEAVRAEHAVVAVSRTPFHVSQLARFEWALVKAHGPLVLGQGPKMFPRARTATGASILVEVGDVHLPPGTTLHLVLARGNKPYALLELTTGAADRSGLLWYNLPRDPSFPMPDEVSLALVDPWRTGDPPRGETIWKLQLIEPEAARLP